MSEDKHVLGTAVKSRHVAGTADDKARSSVMRSGKGGQRWRRKIGGHTVVMQQLKTINKQRETSSGTKRHRDASVGRERGRGNEHDRGRSSHMENQSNQRDHDHVTLNVPWIIGSERTTTAKQIRQSTTPQHQTTQLLSSLTCPRYLLHIDFDEPVMT